MPTIFSKSGKTFRPVASNHLHDILPAQCFSVKKDMNGMYFEEIDGFTLPKKTYAANDGRADRILKTFINRGVATGVLLAGEKGSGKSLLAKTLSVNASRDHQIPTICINAPWHGDEFNQLIQDIQQPAIVLFDEFEKIYNREDQERVLTLLDGVIPSNKLYIFTCNDKYRVDSHMRNRPGRIFYALDFSGLEGQFVREYCEDCLNDKSQIESVLKISQVFKDFNFDMLKALVEEMNRYHESAMDAVKMLNIKPEFEAATTFDVKVRHPEKRVTKMYTKQWKGNPLMQDFEIGYYFQKDNALPVAAGDDPDDAEDNEQYTAARFETKHLTMMDPNTGKYTFTNLQGVTVELVREPMVDRRSAFDYLA